jgi:DHA1 family multidrug resistance protein-like MFS transporter
MKELVRDTVLGHFLRLVTGGKVLPYEEDRDPSLWKRYIDKEKSGRMAHHGHTEEEETNEEEADASDDSTQQQQRAGAVEDNATANTRDSSDTEVGSANVQRNEVSGHPIDPEKGRDVSIVTWFGDDDPEVCSSSARSSCVVCLTFCRTL